MSAPEIAGYRFEQLLLEHPLAEVWRGRASTGMEVVALVLTEAGAREEVRERLERAGREAPLWAANFSTARPYAITQLVPGESGAERLIDPLDGVLGNDDESLVAVRSLLSQYGGVAPAEGAGFPSYVGEPADRAAGEHAPAGGGSGTVGVSWSAGADAVVRGDDKPAGAGEAGAGTGAVGSGGAGGVQGVVGRLGAWAYLVAAVVVLMVFTVTYSVGAAVGAAVKDEPVGAAPVAVSPSALPGVVLLPGLPRISTAPYKRPDGKPGVLGATYPVGADVQVVDKADLPFAVGWPRLPVVSSLGESSTMAYRRIQTDDRQERKVTPDARIALTACRDLADCVQRRASFDQEWTKVYKAPVPSTQKDARTWLAVHEKPYAVMMTRAFSSGGQWWLVGVAVTGQTGEEQDVQRILNDIWRQTS